MEYNLYMAAVSGNIAPFQRFTENSIPLPVNHAMNTVLHVHLTSSTNRSIEFVEFLVERFPSLIFASNIDGDSPLHIAARNRLSDIARFLMTAAAKEDGGVFRILQIKNGKGDTALHEAVWVSLEYIMSLLLERRDDIDISDAIYSTNDLNESPVYIAASRGYGHIVHKLMPYYDRNPSGAESALIGAVLSGNRSTKLYVLDLILLAQQPDLLNWAMDEHKWTPLHYAANGNDKQGYKIVEKLLEFNRNVAYAFDYKKRTALHMAACRGNVHIMEMIMSECPDCIQLTDIKGWNVLHYAVISESDDAVKLVVRDSSFPYLVKERDIRGNTPLHMLAVSRDFLPSFLDVEYLMNLLGFEFPVIAFNRFTVFRGKLLDDLLQPKGLVIEWMNEVGKAPSGINQMIDLNHFQKLKKKGGEEMTDSLDRAKDYHLVVASLVATVTFAAAFTVPGGFISDGREKGTPILMKNLAFKAFFIFDAIAMALSTSSVFVYIILAILQNKRRYDWLMRSALWFIVLAMSAMVLAFVTGAYVALSDSLVFAAFVCVIALSFFVNVFYVTVKIVVDSLSRNQEDGPIYRSLVSIWRRSPFHF